MKRLIGLTVIFMLFAACGSNPPAPAAQPSNTKAPDESAALDAVGKINAAQSIYFKMNRRYALTLDELIDAHLLNSEPTAAQTGYDFNLRPAADAQTYKLSVVPAASSSTARRFFTDQSGVVRNEAGN